MQYIPHVIAPGHFKVEINHRDGKFEAAAGGQKIDGILSVDIKFRPDRLPTVEMTLDAGDARIEAEGNRLILRLPDGRAFRVVETL